MSHRPTCQTADFFVLRSPGLPLAALSSLAEPEGRQALSRTLRHLARLDPVREALALASPDLAARLDSWLEGTLEQAAAGRVERALWKYLRRMSSRSTPFGLFAGVSLGAWGPASSLSVGSWSECRKAVRLDWGVLEALVDRLEQEPEVRASMRYRPNSSLFARGGWYRYLERRKAADGEGRTYHLEAVEATPHLDLVLRQAPEGSCLGDLAADLAGHVQVGPTEARAFLEQLVDAQLLCGELQPPLTGPDPLGQVAATLQANPATAPRAEVLIKLGAELKALQEAPLGAHPRGYGSLAPPLADLGMSAGTRDVLQVDLFRPAPGLALSPRVRRVLEEGAELLRRLSTPPPEGPLDRFRAAFLARYDGRWMPLLDVLDEESGLGFDGGAPMDSSVLEGLPFGNPLPPLPLSARDKLLLARLPRWQGARAWALEDEDLEALAAPEPPPFPQSFAAQATLEASSPEALDRGDFQFWMEQYSGPTAARWLGRFASGDPALREALETHLRKEEAGSPEAVFAELVHVPEGRMGNILARPSLRAYEIPFLATSGVPPERTLFPADLQVTVRGDRVVLASTRLGREVIPRLSSAHNFARGPAVYRFLAHLQSQDGRPGGWSWGVLADQPFLPRVTRGRHVLAKARWRIEAGELGAALTGSREGAWGAFQILRESRGLPRFVTLTEADNALLVDLDQGLDVETLHHLVSNQSSFVLTECFPDPGLALVTSPEGRFAHELVLPFEATTPASRRTLPLAPLSRAPGTRAYPPGSEWLYLKLYCGLASADRLLVELEPLLRSTRAEGLWDRWHFLRYRDPEPHLRLRFHGVPGRLLAALLPRIHQHLEVPLTQGLLWKVQVDTFEPEWERYGGPGGFALAEGWFHADSQGILGRLVQGMTPEQRWRAGLKRTDALWAALGLNVADRKALAEALRAGFRKEFGDSGQAALQLGLRYRDLRKDLASGFPAATGPSAEPDLSPLSALREACEWGFLQEELASLAGSLSHMHLNRLLRSHPREHEWVLMEFLVRLYESHLARFPEPRPPDPGSG